MATSKAKRLIPLAQPKPQNAEYTRTAIQDHAKAARSGNPGAGGPGTQRRRMNPKTNHNLNSSAKAEAAGLMPVKAHVYRSIAELNGGFEKVVHELKTLGGINLFRSNRLTEMRETICRMRAQANRDFALAIHDREKVNAGQFEA
jgi:hypothetical protein